MARAYAISAAMPMISHGSTSGAPTSPPIVAATAEPEPRQPERGKRPEDQAQRRHDERDDERVADGLAQQWDRDSASVYQSEREPLEREREHARVVERRTAPGSRAGRRARASRTPGTTRQPQVFAARRRRDPRGRRHVGDRRARMRRWTAWATTTPSPRSTRRDPGLTVLGRARRDRVLERERANLGAGLLDDLLAAPLSMMPWFEVR